MTYSYDRIGRLNSVGGSGFVTGYYEGTYPSLTWVQQTVTDFASGITHRASGAIKQLTYGNGLQMSLSYNSRQQASQYQVSNFNTPVTVGSNYQYYNDGRIRYAGRVDNNVFDRAYSFDHAARLKDALTGEEARGGSTPDGPYRESYAYDVWGNTVSQTIRLWSTGPSTTNTTYVNNSRQNWGYDANGFVLFSDNGDYQTEYSYDAAGRRNRLVPWFAAIGLQPAAEFSYEFDGNGAPAKQVDTRRDQDPATGQIYVENTTSYYLHSSVLGGQVVGELDPQGNKKAVHVYAQGMRLANETISDLPSGAIVSWEYTDPVTGSKGSSGINREFNGTTELNTLGDDITSPPPAPDPQTYTQPIFADPLKETYYQIEGGPSESHGVDSWYTNMVNSDFDRHMSEVYWRHGFRDWAQAIVASNPNVGVLSNHYDRNGRFMHSELRWGAQAANFLYGISRDIEAGRLVEVRSDVEAKESTRGVHHQHRYDARADFRDYAFQLLTNGQPDDCLKLALLAYKAGQVFGNRVIGGFLEGLTERSGIFGDSDPNFRVGVIRGDRFFGNNGFADAGFIPIFQDPPQNRVRNQVRHFVGWFAAGAFVGPRVARRELYNQEGTNSMANADVALGMQAINMGYHFSRNRDHRALAQAIWRDVCGRQGELNLP